MYDLVEGHLQSVKPLHEKIPGLWGWPRTITGYKVQNAWLLPPNFHDILFKHKDYL